MTPPKASVPNPTGTTPLYTSIRSAKFTGILFSPKELPTPSCGTPSIKTLTCFPLNPSNMSWVSEPTPPASRSFIPGSLDKASLKFFVEFCNSSVSTATALKAERFTRPTPLDTTTTSSNSVTDEANTTFIFTLSPRKSFTGFSIVS